ncbi:MAG: response regulator transcription factor [Desulfobulbaceae bacterium]|uniref:Response regulator transcription factor n=1 Tax=Candidatus Desulfatifera sulfidica TaxID=2841691 RepID=A0A8J6TDH1_9BACT|nr:response regulator transcription factor [Candidatus Desulfatifera sulfidica]
MNNKPLSIVVVDDHPLLLSGLCMLLNSEDDMEVIGQAETFNTALTLITETQPAIVLLDITLHDQSGLDLIPKIHQQAQETQIIIMTMHEDRKYLEKALDRGARGYVLKKGLDVDLLYAIRSVARGEIFIQPSMVKTLITGEDTAVPTPEINHTTQLWNTLSEREQQVVLGVARGYTSKEIAGKYFLSEKTVSTYRSRAMIKLGLDSRAELVEFAMTLGLLQNKSST